MARNLLEQLREMTTVVADSGDINAIKDYCPRDATTNPSLIVAAARMDAYRGVVDGVVRGVQARLGDGVSVEERVDDAVDRLAVAFGVQILEIIPGRVSTEVDAHLSHDTDATVSRGRKLIEHYEARGVARERVLIKIASTWEGIEAARVLEAEGIHCNMTLLFGLHQAVACAEAGVTLISPFVGRIYDWYKKARGVEEIAIEDDPGVGSVREIYNYYKRFGYRTEVMGASFRKLGQIQALAGCDLLTIAPDLLAELQATEGELPRALSPEAARAMTIERVEMSREDFARMHAADPMATEKLADGIARFAEALDQLKAMLRERF